MPIIEISDEVYQYLLKKADPIADNLDAVLKQELGLSEDASTLDTDNTSSTDKEILDKDYDRAILLGLLKMGSGGIRSEVLKHVGEELNHIHSRKGLKKYKSDGMQWVASRRLVLALDGLVTPNSMWQLTEKGQEKARKFKDREEINPKQGLELFLIFQIVFIVLKNRCKK